MLTQGILSCEVLPSWVPTSTAAKMLRVSKQRVYQLQAAGCIIGRQEDGTWLWSVRSIEARIALLLQEGVSGGLRKAGA
jgi:hypothetical protein